jgi:hypothetical protein
MNLTPGARADSTNGEVDYAQQRMGCTTGLWPCDALDCHQRRGLTSMSKHEHEDGSGVSLVGAGRLDRREFLGGVATASVAIAGGIAAPAALAGGRRPLPAAVFAPPPLADVAGKVAFVTGGSSGIGLGMAQAFSAAGMKVIFTYLKPEHRDAALASFKPGNAGVHALRVDVTDRDGMERAADEAERVFGKVHLLCNNAGIGVRALVSNAASKDWTGDERTSAVCSTASGLSCRGCWRTARVRT